MPNPPVDNNVEFDPPACTSLRFLSFYGSLARQVARLLLPEGPHEL